MQEVEAICDRVAIIKKGKLMIDKPLKDLKESNQQHIEVTFDYKIEEQFIQNLPHLKSFKNNFDMTWHLTFDAKEDMRAAIFDFAKENIPGVSQVVGVGGDLLDAAASQQFKSTYGSTPEEFLAAGVPDRVFFATNKSSLTTASRATLRKQATFLRKNKNLNVTIEGHADERGTREYNLALGERRANAAKDYLMTYGISSDRISVLSYGKERPVDSGSNPLAWSKNRRSVSVKAN